MTTPIESATSDVCQVWLTPEDAFDCCADLTDTDGAVMEWAIQQASDLLYHLSGDRFPGVCSAVVRPCANYVSCWYPSMVGWTTRDGGCRRLSMIRLAGYPVVAITEVTIDGVIVPPSEYRVDRGRELIRLADANGNYQAWPGCQRLDLQSGEGTFFVSYTYGQNPPVSGVAAAAQLACAIAKQCPGSNGQIAEDCDLPAGVVRVTRQGVTIDTQSLGVWLIGAMRTGMPLVDAFIAGWGSRPTRRTALSVPEMNPWPLRVG